MANKKNASRHIAVMGNRERLPLIADIRGLIESARVRVAGAVNFELTMLYWRIGKRIHEEVLKEKRAEYGAEIVPRVSAELVIDYGKGFDVKNLWRMVQFAERFLEEKIVVILSRQLSWSHFVAILPVENPLAREFYAQMCRIERWSVRALRAKIDGLLFERTALSKKPEELARLELAKLQEEDNLTPDLIFRDPYLLDFLGLKEAYQEKDLETAILRELEMFIMELGAGFTFVERQKRIIVGEEDYYLDLLFYHRNMRRLIAIELKLGKFKADYKGQMELYLRWLDKNERRPGEEHPLGLILCASKSDEQIELLELSRSGIRVAQYLTQLPPRKILEERLHEAIRLARIRLEYKKLLADNKT